MDTPIADANECSCSAAAAAPEGNGEMGASGSGLMNGHSHVDYGASASAQLVDNVQEVLERDVVVLGGGITGAACAYGFAVEQDVDSVLVLEKVRYMTDTSSRSSAGIRIIRNTVLALPRNLLLDVVSFSLRLNECPFLCVSAVHGRVLCFEARRRSAS